MPSVTLKTGYDLLRPQHRKLAVAYLHENRPFCLMIAFPCSVWSALSHLTAGRDPNRRAQLIARRKREKILVEFAAERAMDQILHGCHFIMENPATSCAWRIVGKLRRLVEKSAELKLYYVRFDQCQFGLLGPGGGPHQKRTAILTSSREVAMLLRGNLCRRQHEHEPVIGGRRVTEKAGHYPQRLAETLVEGVEREFNKLYDTIWYDEMLVTERRRDEDEDNDDQEGEESDGYEQSDPPDPGDQPPQDGNAGDGGLHRDPEGRDPEDELVDDVEVPDGEPSVQDKRMALHLHSVTGHRPPLRLARALVMTGGDPMLVKAAKTVKCEVCAENKAVKTRRPASLPRVRNFGDRIYCDLFSIQDKQLNTHWVAHAVDAATRYQVAAVLERKSTSEVVKFLGEKWFQMLGIPAAITTDMGPEFIAEEFQDKMDFYDVCLTHIPVEAPWMNGVAERAGGKLKVVIRAVAHEHSIIGAEEMQMAVIAALEAVNNDIDQTGYSPSQMVLGKQPRIAMVAGPSDLRSKAASESMMLQEPQYQRIMAFKECARLAMVKLHYSQALRKASVARSRVQTEHKEYKVGDVVYFYREQKPVGKKMKHVHKKRLALKKWHGPAVILAIEGNPNSIPMAAYLAYRGNATKVAMEHLRHASALERLAAEDWDEILEDVVNAVDHGDQGDGGVPALQDGDPAEDQRGEPGERGELPQQAEPLPMLPEHQPVLQQQPQAQPVVVFSYPYPSSLVPSRMATPTNSRMSSRRESVRTTAGDDVQEQHPKPDPSTLSTPSPHDVPVPGAVEDELILGQSSTTSAGAPASSTPAGGAQPSSLQALPLHPGQGERGGRLERAQGALRRSLSEGAEAGDFKRRQLVPLSIGGKVIDVLAAQVSKLHPLVQAVTWAEEDRLQGLLWERDHGTWDGRWTLPSSFEVEAMETIGWLWPPGGAEHEALTTAAQSKELRWSEMSEETRDKFRVAAKEQWDKWLENEAVKVLSLEESEGIYQELQRKGELERILQPRFVLTDKNAALRTPTNDLPLKANARLVVQGFRDLANLQGELRKDAPTASRIGQHILCCVSAFYVKWRLWSCDVRAAFLKGDPYMCRQLFLTCTDPKKGPTIPLGRKILARVLKGVFGLADAPREWYLRLHRELKEEKWMRSQIDMALWWLRDEAGTLHGVLCAHVDDLLVTGDEMATASIERLGKSLGFGSVEESPFTWCGKVFEKNKQSGEVTISMETYHQQLTTVQMNRERRKEPSSALNPAEVRKLKGLLGSLQWLVAQVRFDLAFGVSSLQSEKPTVGTMLRANKLAIEAKKHFDFKLTFKGINPATAGVIVVTDAALGNVDKDGCTERAVNEKVHSQGCYAVIMGDQDMLTGDLGYTSMWWTSDLIALLEFAGAAMQLRPSLQKKVLMRASWSEDSLQRSATSTSPTRWPTGTFARCRWLG